MKNGPPITEVITPTGNSEGATITLDIASHTIRNAPPVITEVGSKIR
jgi:hypothetical protein